MCLTLHLFSRYYGKPPTYLTLNAPNKIAADGILIFYFYLSKKIRLDFLWAPPPLHPFFVSFLLFYFFILGGGLFCSPLFSNDYNKISKIRLDVSSESSASRGFTWNIKSYFFWKTMKTYLWMSSAAVVIGALRVKYFRRCLINSC